MSDEQDKRAKAITEQAQAIGREIERRKAHYRIKLLGHDQEKPLPAGVPLRKRGFGVMD
jgi:hypothetical protein